MTTVPFDLMALPLLVFFNVLCFMSQTRLLRLARTSAQIRSRIRDAEVRVELRPWSKGINVFTVDQNFLTTLSLEPQEVLNGEDWRRSVDEISQLFKTSTTSLTIKTRIFGEYWQWIKRHQKGVKNLDITITRRKGCHKALRMSLDNIELSNFEALRLVINPPTNFNVPFIFQKPPKSIRIDNCEWFTSDHLMDSRPETVILRSESGAHKSAEFWNREVKNGQYCTRTSVRSNWRSGLPLQDTDGRGF